VLLYRLNKPYLIITVLIGGVFSSCVNDLEEIQKVTYDEKAPNEVIQDLDVIYLDSGLAKIQVLSKITEIQRSPESITKLKDKVLVNFYSSKGEIVSTLTALYGEINFSKGEMYVQDSVKPAYKQRVTNKTFEDIPSVLLCVIRKNQEKVIKQIVFYQRNSNWLCIKNSYCTLFNIDLVS